MNFAEIELDEDMQAFWADVRAFFEEHVTEEVHAEERANGGGFNEGFHLALGQRRWVAPRWPVEEGGAGLDPIRARIVANELYRSKAPYILTATTLLPPIAIRMYGSEELKADVLPGVADGTVRICLGYTEPDCGSDLAAVRTRAVRDGDGWLINGQKMFTTGAQFSKYCFCLTRTDPDLAKHKGLTVFLVPLDAPGVEIRPIDTLGGERTNFVYLSDVRIDDGLRIGEVNAGWEVISAPLQQEQGIGADESAGDVGEAYLAQTTDLVLAITAWARETIADDGRPVIDDPAFRERLAEVLVGVELARSTPGPMGRIATSDLIMWAASACADLVGFTAVLGHGVDGAPVGGAFEAGFRFAPGTAIYGGSTDIARNIIAERYLGLPRSTPRVRS